jgi:hypothetical protein
MSAYVHTTAGGRRFHDDPDCRALVAGQSANSDGSSYAGTGYLIGVWTRRFLWPSRRRSPRAARACRVCVPTALALPPTGETYGHEPLGPEPLVRPRRDRVRPLHRADSPVAPPLAATARLGALAVHVGRGPRHRVPAPWRWV